MPRTSSSEAALKYYEEAMKCFEDVALAKGQKFLQCSLKEDPDFFMANYYLALMNLGDTAIFTRFADAAINCKAKLSEAEKILKGTLVKLKKDPKSDLIIDGKIIVGMYPLDKWAGYFLYSFQNLKNDQKGCCETLENMLEYVENKAPVHNLLGYVYMSLNQYDKAEKAFDRYIELSPSNPNVYDSKGDFYMKRKQYIKAYDSFMKAYSLDSAWSYEKAKKALQLVQEKNEK